MTGPTQPDEHAPRWTYDDVGNVLACTCTCGQWSSGGRMLGRTELERRYLEHVRPELEEMDPLW